MRNLFSLVLIFIGLQVFAQETDCIPYHEASMDPAEAKCVYIDCNMDDCIAFLSSLEDYTALESLELINLERDYFPKDLSGMKKLESVSITQCPGLNLTGLCRKFASLPVLKNMIFDNNGMRVLPKTFPLLKNIENLVVRNNENFDVEKSILVMTHLLHLKRLAIPVNQIVDLPENISLLKNLEELDLSDNELTDLPKKMGEMDSLAVLNIEKNVFINPVKSLEKLKGLNIRYLSLDLCLTEKDKNKLSRIFPKAEIIEVVDSSTNEIEDTNIYRDPIDNTDTTEIEYNNIIISGGGFHVLSDAYLHYAEIFDRPNFKSTFDSLLFEERYLDTTYSNVSKIQPWRNYDNIRLFLFKGGQKGEIWFDFHLDYKKKGVPMADPWVTKNNPELLSFLGMKWVYMGNLSQIQFKRKYIKNSSGYRFWMDVRIYYHEKEKNFTIELKDKHGFTQIDAYLVNRNNQISIEKVQDSYLYYYDRYIKALDNRRKRFHKRLLKDKSAYDMTLQRSMVSAWDGFRKIYMSPEEQKMSMKTWLEYYDRVIADEPTALQNSSPTTGLLERSLVLNGYMDASTNALIADTNMMKGVYAMFRDDQEHMVAIPKVLVVNMKERTYRTFEGSLGLKNIRLYFEVGVKYAIIAQIRNGDLGIIIPEEFISLPLKQNMEYVYTLTRMPGKIVSIGQIQQIIGY